MLRVETFTGGPMPTNCYLLIDKSRAVIFDFVPEVVEYVAEQKLIIDKIFLTHVHYDHIEGLYNFLKENVVVELVLTEEQKSNINNPFFNLLQFRGPIVKSDNYGQIELEKVSTIDDNSIIEWEGHSIKVLKTPGHSAESVVFMIDEVETIISGDTIFKMSVGRYDLPGSSHNSLINSIKRVIEHVEKDYIIYPGHGPSTTVEFEKLNNPFIN